MVRLTNYAARGAYSTVVGSSFGAQHTSEPAHPSNHHLHPTVNRRSPDTNGQTPALCFDGNNRDIKTKTLIELVLSEASYEARNEPEECLSSTMAGRSRAVCHETAKTTIRLLLLAISEMGWTY